MVLFAGKTVEEAIEKGLKELNIPRMKAHIKVVSREKKGFLGFGKKPAQVDIEAINDATVHKADQKAVKGVPDYINKQNDPVTTRSQDTMELGKVTSLIKKMEERGETVEPEVKEQILENKKTPRSILEETGILSIIDELKAIEEDGKADEILAEVETAQSATQSDKILAFPGAKRQVEAVEPTEVEPIQAEVEDSVVEEAEEAASETSEESAEVSVVTESIAEDEPVSQDDSFEAFIANEFPHTQEDEAFSKDIEKAAQDVADYVDKIIYEMDLEAQIHVSHNRRQINLQIETQEPGRVIGYHGKVLKSLQLLAQNYLHDQYTRNFSVSINVHDYMEHRTEILEEFAHKIANRVLESGRDYLMDPMSNAERKIIHKTISKISGVESYSEGDDPNRYVVVIARKDY